MSFDPQPLRELVSEQGNVVTRGQAMAAGLSPETIMGRATRGRWQRLERGVYAAFTGDPARESMLWAALLRAGPAAVFSHQTAAELHGLVDRPSPVIHVAVPADRHPARWSKIPGMVIHRSTALYRTRHPVKWPPRTRVEDTVLDLIESAASFDEAYDWICRAIGRRHTTAERLRAGMDARARFRWRRDIELALNDASEGVLSLLELRYVRGVERPHGLPVARRQARIGQRNGSRYLDNLYEDYFVCVELDGTAAHPADEQWRDKRRDRVNLAEGKIVTVRLGFMDLRTPAAQCDTAAQVAAILADRAPTRTHACRLACCPVPASHDLWRPG
jgi:putative AbiEi antitoxin of type IV toxin-antitoxin system